MTMWQVRESESVPSLPAERSHFPTRVPRRVRVTMLRQVETLDGWEKVLYINMYGCERFGYVEHLRATAFTCAARDGGGGGVGTTSASWGACEFEARENVNRHTCYSSVPRGWLAAAYFVTLVVVGALLMPTALIGVISLSFDESRRELADEMASERARAARGARARERVGAREARRPRGASRAQRGPWIAKATERALRALFDGSRAPARARARRGGRGAVGGIGGGGCRSRLDLVRRSRAVRRAAQRRARQREPQRGARRARGAPGRGARVRRGLRRARRAGARGREAADARRAAASQLRARAAALGPTCSAPCTRWRSRAATTAWSTSRSSCGCASRSRSRACSRAATSPSCPKARVRDARLGGDAPSARTARSPAPRRRSPRAADVRRVQRRTPEGPSRGRRRWLSTTSRRRWATCEKSRAARPPRRPRSPRAPRRRCASSSRWRAARRPRVDEGRSMPARASARQRVASRARGA